MHSLTPFLSTSARQSEGPLSVSLAARAPSHFRSRSYGQQDVRPRQDASALPCGLRDGEATATVTAESGPLDGGDFRW